MSTQDFKRKLTAIFSADVVGYSRLMGEDESATVRTLETYKGVVSALIKQHRGRVVDSPGDNLLAEFASVVDAVQCGVAVQKELQARNADLPENRKMQFRIGINLGDVIEEGERIYGDGVNIAARIEGLAAPGGICISGTAFDHVEDKVAIAFECLGEQAVKNIRKPVRVYKLLMEPGVLLQSTEELKLPEKPSIAVLPFVNMSGDPEQEYFRDGLTEDLITALSKEPQIFVIARNSTFTYKDKAVKVQQVAKDLGVQYVLEGSVQKAGDRVRVTAQLVDALKGHHLWAERYDRELKDIFGVLDEITMKIITSLQVKLIHGDYARFCSCGSENLEAYLKVLEARSFLAMGAKEGNERSKQLAEAAIAIDPEFASAYYTLGSAHTLSALSGFTKNPRESLEIANIMLRKAIELDGSSALARGGLGFNLLLLRRYDEAIAEGERAYEMAPNSDIVLLYWGSILWNVGRAEEAVSLLERALRLNPRPMNTFLRSLGSALRECGRYAESLSSLEKAVQKEPEDFHSQVLLTATCIMAGREEMARATAKEVLRLSPRFAVDGFMRLLPLRDPNRRERLAKALKKAGLPD